MTTGATVTPRLRVRTSDGREFRLVRPFVIGRELDCDVRVEDGRVSRRHATVSFEDGRWMVRNQSGNGVFVGGRRMDEAAVDRALTITLGAEGPGITLEVESAAAPAPRPPAPPVAGGETMMYIDRYLKAIDGDEPVGGRTMMIRKAFQKVQRKQKRKYTWIIAAAAALAIAAIGYAYYSHRQVAQQKVIAEELFYQMKSLDVEFATLEQRVAASGSKAPEDQVRRYLERRRQMETNYDRFISGLKLYDHNLSPQEQLILRVTRLLGECETAAPPEYLAEVGSYIRRWQSSPRFARSIGVAQSKGYTRRIAEAFQKQNLPPQFFYLALQESDFNEVASGPPTRWGYAKGMWQLIPDTAKRFGLSVGPLVAYPRPDPGDDRHKWEKATDAAARYIKEIYSTDAQASGLLVMASYNWGEQRVITMIRTLPENPRERNFWKLLARYREKIPNETYNYVLSIISAAVIGENPRLFGFGFDNPLAFVDLPAQSGN
ncbi:MAG TPA: transglycosylase SLT domain-containing protein [Vicinamibacterales bacterium]|nr:transglycosylase SLT domain-containing protein [Vicinamibacterales bacterium]